MNKNLVPIDKIESKIHLLRGQRVMFDSDLAELYGVTTFNLNKTVKRNLDRFPDDFMFQLSESEFQDLRFQIGISSSHGGRRRPPFVFSEQGVAMLSSVLRSDRAVRVNVEIMRVFVKLRKLIGTHEELARKIGELEKKVKNQDSEIKVIFATINTMLHPVPKKKPQIGFKKVRS